MKKFIPLGGADEIGASCYYLNLNGTGILLDCGIHPRKTGLDSIPDFSLLELQPLDAVIISHAHQDHVGALPFLIKKFPHVKIYSTVQTKEILNLTLHNAVAIVKRQLSEADGFQPYTHQEVDLLVRSIRDYKYGEEFSIKGLTSNSEEVKIVFSDAGHILGSASILLKLTDHRILFTGDINFTEQTIMNGADYVGQEIDTLITETTYGSTESNILSDWETEGLRFAKFINKILNTGGSILIPVFSLGKYQEILAKLHYLMHSGKLTYADIYTAGLGRKIAGLYDQSRYLVKRKDPNFELKSIPQEDIVLPGFFNAIKRSPGIVIASSGMILERTVSFELAKHWLRQKDYGIGVVGYMDTETPGYKIAGLKPGDKISLTDNSEIVNKCIVKKFHFTSHSRREDIVAMCRRLSPSNIILVHGEETSRDWIGRGILSALKNVKLYSPSVRSEIAIN